MMKQLGLCIALSLACAGAASAGAGGAGTTAANFLSVGSGAGILGMGGATLGLAQGLTSLNWNVASLGWLDENEVAISHAGLAEESRQEWAAFGGRIGRSQTRWSVSGLYQSDGSFEGRDASNNSTGTFGASSTALAAHFAQRLGPRATVGLGAKWVSEKLGDASGGGLTFDAGAQFRAGMIGFGAAAQNAGGKMSYGSASYPFPSNYGVGVSLDHPSGLRVALDANFPSAYYTDVRSGVEYRWRDRLALRAGYRKEMGASSGERLTGPTFGMGAGSHGIWVDYGYLISGNGDAQHRLGLSFHPGMFGGAGAAGLGSTVSPEPAPARPAPAPKAAPPSDPAPKKQKVKKAAHAPDAKSATAPAAPTTDAKSAPAAAAASSPATVATPSAVTPAPQSPAPDAASTSAASASPAPATTTPAAGTTAEPRPDKVTVKAGDTLASIAKRYGVTVTAMMMQNNLVSDEVQVGEVLKLPKPSSRD